MQAATITALDSLQQLDISAPTMNSSTTSSAASSSFSDSPQQPPPQPQRRNRGLSLHIGDMVASTTSQNKRHSTGSTSRSSSPPPCEQRPNELSIEIEGGQQLIIRPNRVVRGYVVLKNSSTVHASQIRIKFRAEEVATVKVRETGLDQKMDRIDQMTTTYFDVGIKVWGPETSNFQAVTWDSIEPGEHKFPFALKFPNVNYPPSTDDPSGFYIRYIWTAHLDGAAVQPGLRSKEYMLPYRPIICAPPAKEWTLQETLYKSDRRTPLARIKAILPQQAYCPDEPVELDLQISCIPSDLIVSDLSYLLKKHHDGKLRLQRGTAVKSSYRSILQANVGVTGNDGTVRMPVRFQMPSRLVSPSFASKNIRVYYSLILNIQFESLGSLLKKSTYISQITIPITVANLPNSHLLRVPDLTAVQSYTYSTEAPYFFDPSLDEPPESADAMSLAQTPLHSPPNYFSLPSLPPQLLKRERQEKTLFTTRLVRPGVAPELGKPTFVHEYHDEEWW